MMNAQTIIMILGFKQGTYGSLANPPFFFLFIIFFIMTFLIKNTFIDEKDIEK